jgi:uncharacterized protein (DUF1697 family)
MPRYVAFLRAINVGGHVVKMDQLRRLFEETSLANVETFIASGNVIFESRANANTLEGKIEKHLKQNLGYEVATFLRTIPEITAIADYRPFSNAELSSNGDRLYVGFLPAPPAKEATRRVLSLAGAVDDFHAYGRELYWLCRKSFSESEVSGALLEKTLGMPATFRNVNTIRRLVSKYA